MIEHMKYLVVGALFISMILLLVGGVIGYLNYVENPNRPKWVKVIITGILVAIFCYIVGGTLMEEL